MIVKSLINKMIGVLDRTLREKYFRAVVSFREYGDKISA